MEISDLFFNQVFIGQTLRYDVGILTYTELANTTTSSTESAGSSLGIILGVVVSGTVLLVSALVFFAGYLVVRRMERNKKQLTALVAQNSESKKIELTSIRSPGAGWTVVTFPIVTTSYNTIGRTISLVYRMFPIVTKSYNTIGRTISLVYRMFPIVTKSYNVWLTHIVILLQYHKQWRWLRKS